MTALRLDNSNLSNSPTSIILTENARKKSIKGGQKKDKKTKPDILKVENVDVNGVCCLSINVITGPGRSNFLKLFRKHDAKMLDTRSPHALELASLANMINDCLGGDMGDESLASIKPFETEMASFGISEDIILECGISKLTESQVSQNGTAD